MPTNSPTYQIKIPEQGQIATVRQRRYVVNDVKMSSLPLDPMHYLFAGKQHLVSLTSLEDDALGETLEVIWELEPGARVEEKVGLPNPTGFDSPDRLDAFLHAINWGAISAVDTHLLQSPFRSGIEIEEYQLAPLVRALQMPRTNLLIADDVGLGKTIEAGLIVQELILRNRARTTLVVCPAGLQIHWRDQMREKFGLEFRIVDSKLMKRLRRERGIHVNPWGHFPRLITSIDFIKRDRPMRLFKEVIPSEISYPRRFDILIVDEAHNVAPSGGGKYAIDSQRTQAIRTIAPHFEHKLFLSATPHNGYQESFTSLLELLDNQRFARGVHYTQEQLRQVMVRRLKYEIKDFDGKPRFPTRRIETIPVPYSATEKNIHGLLKEYTKLRLKNADSASGRYGTEFVMKLLKKRLFSSPNAFLLTLEVHENHLNGIEKQNTKKREKLQGILRRQITQSEESFADDEEHETDMQATISLATRTFTDLSPREKQLIQEMKTWAQTACNRLDDKTKAFISWLESTIKPNGEWNDERVIIFTEYRATQAWLFNVLATRGYAMDDRMAVIYGGMDEDERESIKAAFQASPDQSSVRILLATDAASEGIDLQNHCHRLVHYEIPWNPNRMEQRNGRIDRHGQRFDPLIFHFISSNFSAQPELLSTEKDDLAADLEFLMKAVRKVEQIREDIGKVGPVIAKQVEDAMLGRSQVFDTSMAEQEASAASKMLKFEQDLRKRMEEYANQLRITQRELDISPHSIQSVVTIALELAQQLPLRPYDGPKVELKSKAFYLPKLTANWAQSTEGLEHPHTGEVRPIVFDQNLANGRDDVVYVHLNHRLVQNSVRLLRAEIWSLEDRRNLNRATVRVVPDYALDTPAVIGHARLVITGGDSHQLHEQIITAGGTIKEGRFRRFERVGVPEELLSESQPKQVSAELQRRLLGIWENIESNLMRSLEVRVENQLRSMQRMLDSQQQKQITDIKSILNELKTAIKKELSDPEYRQLEIWKDEEREQLRRNQDAIRMRLEQIPEEMEKEIQSIMKHFADPIPRMFPVAITFLVPAKMAERV